MRLIERLYGLYQEVVQDFNPACARYCSHCCTINVTITSLEGYLVSQKLADPESPDFYRHLEKAAGKRRFQPALTLNRLASQCLKGEPAPEENCDPRWGECPFLMGNQCPIYQARPFNCRCMISKVDCGHSGCAEMDKWWVTLNNVFLQVIEQLDADGFSGNLTDVLMFMRSADNRRRYGEHRLVKVSSPFVANSRIPALMIPPPHRDRMAPVLQAIRKIDDKGR